MAETRIQSYYTAGNFVFTATVSGLHRFHVIGKGGNGFGGGSGLGADPGGRGGNSGGYAIHQAVLSQGETIQIEISTSLTQLVCQGQTVTAYAGDTVYASGTSTDVSRTASGGNVSNTQGNLGSAGSPASGKTGGRGGNGALSVGKYQANGGSGGYGGSYGGSGSSGGSAINTETSIGGAGGGGGGAGSPKDGSGGSSGRGGTGQIGGVVVELINSAPSAPAWIDADNPILGGKETAVRWGEATDPDGNLAGYVLERSVDSGTWAEVYRGPMRAFTDVIIMGWQTVQYRVKAYDTENIGSGYVSTNSIGIVNNRPPSPPSSIIVREPINGGTTITVSWGQASDSDNNVTGYTLERSVNSGGWEAITNANVLTAQAQIAFGWNTVQFRVRAYDSYGAVSEYANSPVFSIVNNRAPTISGEDLDLGTMIETFEAQYFTVDDPDGDEVTVTITLDGMVKNTFTAQLGVENAIEIPLEDWRKVANGAHTIEIIAQDRPLGGTEGKRSKRTFTFIKSVQTIGFRLANPLLADARPEKCILSAQGAFPNGCILRIEVCNNANDTAPAWEEISQKVLTGQKHFFKNTSKTAAAWGVGVRVSLERGTATGDCYIHSLRGNYA